MRHAALSLLFSVGLLLGLLVLPSDGMAQVPTVRLIEGGDGTATYEMTVDWSQTLRAAVDSAGITAVDAAAVLSVTGGVPTIRRKMSLSSLALPTVRVVAADYDDVALPPGEDDAVLAALQRPAVRVGQLGVERKQPTASLEVRLATYDATQQRLRRYRRIVVSVRDDARGKQPSATAAFRAAQDDTNPHLSVDRSVLADGTVYKIPIRTEGVYRIDRSFLSDLPQVGNLGSLDPNRVQVFHNGGAPLPALNSAPRPADLVETPVFVRGGSDGSFDDGDAVFFYARGPSGWQYTVERSDSGAIVDERWTHYVHPYDTTSFVFIKIDDAENARVGSAVFPNLAEATVLDQAEGRYVKDFDEYMWSREAGTGLTWVSNLILDGGSQVLLENETLPGLQDGTAQVEVRAAAGSTQLSRIRFDFNGATLGTVQISGRTNNSISPIARSETAMFSQQVSGGGVSLSVTYLEQGGAGEAAVDWLRVFYPKALRPTDGMLRFATPGGQTGSFEYRLRGFSQEPQVWDVTSSGTIRRLGIQREGDAYRVQVSTTDAEQPREVLAFSESAVRSLDSESVCPNGACRVAPQNLHGISSYPEFVIVTPVAFREAAESLAEHRRQRDGMAVQVALVEQLYNEFSGGQVDPRAIRDYFRFLYDRGPGDDPALRYALLLGDGHYNYRQLGQQAPVLTNWVPSYQTEESFDPDRSYTSDDYFGLLDPDEGRWVYTFYTSPGPRVEKVDIGIGRMPVQSLAEAQLLIDKIRQYEDPANYGAWRSRYLFIADDGYNGLSAALERSPDLHTQNIEVAAEQVEAVEPSLNQQKVYAISYPRVFLNGWRIPGAKEDMMNALREGVLVANYSGHGGEFGLAQEEVFTRDDARSLSNGDRMPVFITATCSFGRWDLAREQSGAEEMLLNDQGGAIALLTTVRTVYTRGGTTSLNVGLNRQLNEDLFQRDASGLPLRLGDALRATKNTEVGVEGNNRKFNLLGDPTLRLGLPPRKTVVTTVNGAAVAEQTAQIRALDRLTLQGEVQTQDGQLDPTFNGTVNLSIFDAQRQIDIDPEFVSLLRDRPYYRIREDLIWRGRVQAEGGQFEATFVVPKDISYSDKPGRISAYAASSTVQANGFTENVIVGGTADNPPDDDVGPEIDLYVNSDNFVSGGLTPPRPRVVVDLFDDSGINTVGAGVGHDMLLIVDGDEQNAIDIGDLYESEEDSYRRGRVEYAFEEPLAPGPHTLTVRAWDVLNNSGTAEIDLVVSDATDLELANVFNYPNPTTGPTRFVFEHNQPLGTSAAVQVRVYTLSGQPIATLEEDVVLEGGPAQVLWDGLDDDFDRLAPGVYLYKIRVEVQGRDGERHVSERIEKLAVVR